MFNIGDKAREFAELSDDELLDKAMKSIKTMYPKAGKPKGFIRTNWSKEEHFYCSFGFASVEEEKERDRDQFLVSD